MPAQVHEPFEADEQNDTSAIEPSTPENDQNEQGKKKSVLGKVKDKAKKLKSKIKSSSGKKRSGNEDGSNASGSIDSDEENDNSSLSSESERSPSTDEVDGTEAALKAEKGGDTKATDFPPTTDARDSFETHSDLQERENDLAEDPSVTTPGVESMESDYSNDLRASEEKSPLESESVNVQKDVPPISDAGGETFAADHFPTSTNVPDSSETHTELQELENEPPEDPSAPTPGVESMDSDNNEEFQEPEGKPPLESESVNVQHDVLSPSEQPSDEAVDDLRFKELKLDADGASSDHGYKSNEDSAIVSDLPDEVPVAASSDELTTQGDSTLANKDDEFLDSLTGTKVNADGENLPSREDANANEQTWTEKATETVSGAKGAALENLGYGGKEANPADYFLSGSTEKSDREESTNLDSTAVESDADFSKLSETTPENTPSSEVNEPHEFDSPPPVTDSETTNKVKETAQTFAGSIASTLGYDSSSAARDDPTASEPTNSEDKTVTQKIFDSAAAAKETVASKLPYASSNKETTDDKDDSDTTSLNASDQSPSVTQTTRDSANSNLEQVKDTVAAGTAKAKEAVNSGISQAKDGTVSAKDATVSRFHPDEEDEALSESITHFLSPSHIKDVLVGGFSSKSTEPRQDANPPAQGKGVISRVTDAVSSLLGSKSHTNEDPQHQLHDQEKQPGEDNHAKLPN